MNTASEMTSIVSGGALNSTQTKYKKNYLIFVCSVGASASAAAATAAAADAKLDRAACVKQGRSLKKKEEQCVICLEPMSDVKQLDCGHRFCADCIAEYFEKGQPKCPSCGQLYGMLRGNQPHGGTFTHRSNARLRLAGYERHGALEITYRIPDGVQTVSLSISASVFQLLARAHTHTHTHTPV